MLLLNLFSKLLFLNYFDLSLCFFLLESHDVLCELFKDFSVLLLDKDLSMQSYLDFYNYSSYYLSS